MSNIKKREIRWGKAFGDYYAVSQNKAFDLLISDATDRGYLKGFGSYSLINIVKLDRFCRDVLDAELIIGESTGRINGIRFSKQEDCIHFRMRVD